MIGIKGYSISPSSNSTFRLAGILVLSLGLLVAQVSSQQTGNAPLTNQSVIKLVKAGFKEKTIIAIINSRPNQFKLDTEQLIQLKQNGVGESIILAMLSQDEGFVGSEDDWGSDSMFRKSNRGNGNSEGADIFGSNNGSNSQSRTRGSAGGNDKENNVTGSATVRILRPQTEAGGTPPKLERTPTLNNEAVIRLVEAGFSEGTIIKRIEDSPADFDLSPAKIEELQKRRVTGPVISAMTAAMKEDGEAKPTAPSNQREE
jgi:hypothetical protein